MIQTTVYFDEALKQLIDAETTVFGTQRKVLAAAIWMFAHSTDEAKISAIRSVASHVEGNAHAAEQDAEHAAREADAQVRRSNRATTRRKTRRNQRSA